MRTGLSCNVRNVHRKSEPVRISMGIKVNRCAVHTLQISWVRIAHPTEVFCESYN